MGLKTIVAALAAAALGSHGACAAEVRVLSAGAVETGLRPALVAYERTSGDHVTVIFMTPMAIRDGIQAGTPFDLVITPPAVLDTLASAGRVTADPGARTTIGRVGIGVAVRPGAARPDIGTPEAFTRAVQEADSVVYNRASTGVYLEGLLKRLNLDVQAKTTRYADGAMVMDHVLHGTGRELALGAITEIRLARELQFVGPLPAALQNYTTYRAATASAEPETARALLRYLGSPEARAEFTAAGIEPTE
jgi:molybdate transport system substrate-binding protein